MEVKFYRKKKSICKFMKLIETISEESVKRSEMGIREDGIIFN